MTGAAPATSAPSPLPTPLPISLNQATMRTTPTVGVLDACRHAGIQQVSLWRDQYVEDDVAITRRAVDDHGLAVSSLCRGGFFTGTRSVAAAAADNQRAVEEAHALGTPVLVLVCGPVLDDGFAAAEARIAEGIAAMLPAARAAGVTLAIEPFHPMLATQRSAVVTLRQAGALAARFAGEPVGLAVDSYHLWWDPTFDAELRRVRDQITVVQLGDWLADTDVIADRRGLPGDGVIDLGGYLATVTELGYYGAVEIEVLNPDVWALDARTLALDLVARMAALLPALATSTPS